MNPAISEAVTIFREFPNSSDEEIFLKLLAVGVERITAARLTEFLPMAYCRLILADSGVKFCDCFHRKLADGTLSPARRLDAEPLWTEARSFADAEGRTGVRGEALLLVAAHSGEFDAVNQLANRGSKLGNIVLTPTVFQWPEAGPIV